MGSESLTSPQGLAMSVAALRGTLEEEGGPQHLWDQGLSPPRTTESPRKLLKCISVWVFRLHDLTVLGWGSRMY